MSDIDPESLDSSLSKSRPMPFDDSEESDWNQLAASQFEKGYAATDAIYDTLDGVLLAPKAT